jgi:hypothetical protein
MKQPTLNEMALKHQLLERTLYRQLGIDGNPETHAAVYDSIGDKARRNLETHVSYRTGNPGTYSLIASSRSFGWDLGNYLGGLSLHLSGKIQDKGVELGSDRFSNFRPDLTKLPNNMVEEIWPSVSEVFRFYLHEAHGSGEFDIPGLKHGLDKGAIIPCFGHVMRGPDRTEEIDAVRQLMIDRLEYVDDVDVFLRAARNDVFESWRKSYGIFPV